MPSSYYADQTTLLTDKKRGIIRDRVKWPNMTRSDLQLAVGADSYILAQWADEDKEMGKLLAPYLKQIDSAISHKYDENTHPEIAYNYLKNMGTKKGTAGKLGVAFITMMKWYHNYPSFKKAFDEGYAAGQQVIDQLLLEQALNPNAAFDNKAVDMLMKRRKSAHMRKSIIGKNLRESLDNLIQRYEEDIGELTSRDASAMVAILDRCASLDEMTDLKDQINDAKKKLDDLKG